HLRRTLATERSKPRTPAPRRRPSPRPRRARHARQRRQRLHNQPAVRKRRAQVRSSPRQLVPTRASPPRRAHRARLCREVFMANRRIELLLAFVALMALFPRRALADDDADAARAAFVEGTTLVKNAQWAEALAAFERADKLKSHPVTTYNIAACERAMGRYTR